MYTKSREVFSEVYPVQPSSVSNLSGWKLDANSGDIALLGWKMAYRLSRLVGDHWIWTGRELVTDARVVQTQIDSILQTIWNDQSAPFGNVRSIRPLIEWQPSMGVIANFVALGLCPDLDWSIQSHLRSYRQIIRNARVERDYYIRGWRVGEEPAISISLSSHIVANMTLRQYIATLHNPSDLQGLMVKDVTGNYKGEVTQIIGPLVQHRKRLMGMSKRDKMKQLLRDAPDNDLVVRVQSGYNEGYDYVASALEIIVRTKDYARLQIDGQQALNALQIRPDTRFTVIEEIAQIVQPKGWIDGKPYSKTALPVRFLNEVDLSFKPKARLGDDHICECDARVVLNALKSHPPYKRSLDLGDNLPIRVGVLNMIGEDRSIPSYLNVIRQRLHDVQYPVKFTTAQRPEDSSHSKLEQAIQGLATEQPHIIMALVPGSANREEEDTAYSRIKIIALQRDLQSQVIYANTLHNQYAIDNIVLGILAKTGNVPYVLSEKLPYTDFVAGIDIARERTVRRSGSINVAAMTRIYSAEGDFVRYVLDDTPLEGETLNAAAIRRLFPEAYFSGKKSIVHRDGPFRGNEPDSLRHWAQEIGAEFYLVEVIKSGVPRLYSRNDKIDRPQKGDIFVLNELEALLVSSLPAHSNSTPQPLLVRTDGQLDIKMAVHSVLSMTMLHYGSLRPPRLPVTIHYSDRIGYLALRGIKPSNHSGTGLFWV